MRKVKQGQTYYLDILFNPGSFSNYPDEYVGVIYKVFVRKVKASTVWYTTYTNDGSQHYLSHREFFNKKMHSSKKKAMWSLHNSIRAIN